MAAIPSDLVGSARALVSASRLASDATNLDTLRYSAGKDPRGAARETAKQFESLFLGQLLKSMRAATPSSGLMDNAGTQLGTEMLDAQLANKMAGRPGGLSEVIARHLERQMGVTPGPIPSTSRANNSLPMVSDPASTPRIPDKSAAGFVQQHSDAAQVASAATGIHGQPQPVWHQGWRQLERPDGGGDDHRVHRRSVAEAGAGLSRLCQRGRVFC